MQVQIALTQGQANYASKILTKIKTKREAQIAKCIQPSATADLEILAIEDLITAFSQAKPVTVELPVLPEALG